MKRWIFSILIMVLIISSNFGARSLSTKLFYEETKVRWQWFGNKVWGYDKHHNIFWKKLPFHFINKTKISSETKVYCNIFFFVSRMPLVTVTAFCSFFLFFSFCSSVLVAFPWESFFVLRKPKTTKHNPAKVI